MDKGFIAQLAKCIDFAFQPIVSFRSGRCHGVEALMRGWEHTGLSSIEAVFDYAYKTGMTVEVDKVLKRLAFEKFLQIQHCQDLKLFFNLDNRLFASPDYHPDHTIREVEFLSLPPSSIVFEVSERQHLNRSAETYRALKAYAGSLMQIAIDDFGVGFSGLALLYDTHPDYIKIDRYFISNIASDHKKKVFLSHVVSLAKTLGIQVIAEGVETEQEFYTCREIGCDLVQGYLIQRPTTIIEELLPNSPVVIELREKDRRSDKSESRFVMERLDPVPAMDAGMEMRDIFESFRLNPDRSFFPFLDANHQPSGLVHEADLKKYIYSPYGRDLLTRKKIGDHLDLFVRRCPVADVNTPIDTILKQFSVSPSREGLLITADGRYIGLLSAQSLVLAMQERNIELARDQNPLTGLPGNPSIERFLTNHESANVPVELLYFDLDNFKVFNDSYGFRSGDRALRMFADLLQKAFAPFAAFVGHIGGDDFFVGVSGADFGVIHQVATQTVEEFKSAAESLYSEEHRQAGRVTALDRRQRPTDFPLLSASCAFLSVQVQSKRQTENAFLSLITVLKKEVKLTGNSVATACLA